jgi:hypothetical protein
MPQAIEWTDRLDAELRRMRCEFRWTWDACALAMDVDRSSVIKRAASLGFHGPLPNEDDARRAARRGTRPAWHPETWGLLLAHTASLAGCAYPMLVYAA